VRKEDFIMIERRWTHIARTMQGLFDLVDNNLFPSVPIYALRSDSRLETGCNLRTPKFEVIRSIACSST
jgi:hypothetical protein